MGNIFPVAAVVASFAAAVAGIILHAWWLAAVGGVAVLVTGFRWALYGRAPRTFRNMDDHSAVDPIDVGLADGDGGGDGGD